MNVLILGSMKGPENPEDFEKFKEACRQVGRALRNGDYTIVLGSDNTRTADLYVMEGFASGGGNGRAILHYPEAPDSPRVGEENEIPFSDGAARQTLSQLKPSRRSHRGSWIVAQTAALSEADVVVLMGGFTRCDTVVWLAEVLKKPLLAVKAFDGTAEKVWPEYKRQYTACGVTEEEIEAIGSPWDAERSCTAVVSAAFKLYQKNPFKTQPRPRTEWSILAASLLLFFAWVITFYFAQKGRLDGDLAIWILLPLATLMGTIGRLWREPFFDLTGAQLRREIPLAIFLGLALALFYLGDGFLLNGTVKKLESPNDFMRVTISLSIIGIAVGLVRDAASFAVNAKLRAYLSRER